MEKYIKFAFIRALSGAGEMAQCAKMLASKTDAMSSIPGAFALQIEKLPL